jgi:head-tail adaptor
MKDEPRVATDSQGNAVVAYIEQNSVWAHTYSQGAWSPAERLSLGGSHQPSVSMNPDGTAVVVWRQGENIWAAVFD